LRHNFAHRRSIRKRNSTIRVHRDQRHRRLGDEYNAVNIAAKGSRQGTYGMKVLGRTILGDRYGYKEIAPDQEADELKRVAARNKRADARVRDRRRRRVRHRSGSESVRPRQRPARFRAPPLHAGAGMWDRWQTRTLKPGENYTVLRRIVERGLIVMTGASTNVAKYIGGVTNAARPCRQPRAPLTPIDSARQRER